LRQILFIIGIIGALISTGVLGFKKVRLHQSHLKAGQTILMIEAFRQKQHRLPATLSEAGQLESEDSLIHYQLEGPNTYTIWYGLSLGESSVYSSRDKTWTTGG